ncbi:hypothetical protein KP509_13G050200 [Ceratopteris richardii]|nr:hypothetical protein KP509_13G050200 [Ceratopteris richardii]
MLVLLYYYRCTKFIKYYICFSAAFMLSTMGGTVVFQLIQTLSIPLDIVSFLIFILNFTVVGALAIFMSNAMPILITQFYLVMIGMLAAFWFTMLPEWTTWMTLVAMAVYDLFAVLAPGGPLNLLVELVVSRDEEFPALIYETRPVARPDSDSNAGASNDNQHRRRWRSQNVRRTSASEDAGPATELQPQTISSGGRNRDLRDLMDEERQVNRDVHEDNSEGRENNSNGSLLHENIGSDDESIPLVSRESMPSVQVTSRSGNQGTHTEQHNITMQRDDDDDDHEGLNISALSATGSLRLGLGDFVFYSLLVGRAAMYDLTTVYACYLAIIAGLGATLILLAVARRALPALPISVTLGIIFYFLTRLLMEPLVIGLSTTLLIF